MRCAGCGRAARKTTLAYLPTDTGSLRRARVCATCERTAIVVVPSVSSVACAAAGCTSTAAWCVACATKGKTKGDVTERMTAAAARLRNLATAYRAHDEDSAFARGLDQAADVIEAGDF